jgi:hypothetical protein
MCHYDGKMLGCCCCAGGGGGAGPGGGGGGAGGLIFRPSIPVTPGATFAVVVGGGGLGFSADGAPPTPGDSSSFGSDPTLVAIGGGPGVTTVTPVSSSNGGSGGGGASFAFPDQGSFSDPAGGSGTPGQGETCRLGGAVTCWIAYTSCTGSLQEKSEHGWL